MRKVSDRNELIALNTLMNLLLSKLKKVKFATKPENFITPKTQCQFLKWIQQRIYSHNIQLCEKNIKEIVNKWELKINIVRNLI